jgi:hypothetical protein
MKLFVRFAILAVLVLVNIVVSKADPDANCDKFCGCDDFYWEYVRDCHTAFDYECLVMQCTQGLGSCGGQNFNDHCHTPVFCQNCW